MKPVKVLKITEEKVTLEMGFGTMEVPAEMIVFMTTKKEYAIIKNFKS